MNKPIKCESCDGLILSSQVNIYDKTIKPGVQARLWECPHCNGKHPIMVMDKKSRRMMQDNKKDREKISGINKRSAKLKQSNQLKGSQAQSFLTQTEKLRECIEKRTAELDQHSQVLMNEYKEAL